MGYHIKCPPWAFNVLYWPEDDRLRSKNVAIMWPECIYNITVLIYSYVLTEYNTLYRFVTTQREGLCQMTSWLVIGYSWRTSIAPYTDRPCSHEWMVTVERHRRISGDSREHQMRIEGTRLRVLQLIKGIRYARLGAVCWHPCSAQHVNKVSLFCDKWKSCGLYLCVIYVTRSL